MQSKSTPKAVYIELVGKDRSDGSMFVSCPKLTFFTAVVDQGDWQAGLHPVPKTPS